MLRSDPDCEHDAREPIAEGCDHASATRAPRTVFSLIECPPLGPGNFALVKRDERGAALLLMLGRATFLAPTLNLGLVRLHGAALGADEVHYWGSGI